MSEDFEAPKDDLDKELPAGSEEHSDYKPADAKDANIKHQLSNTFSALDHCFKVTSLFHTHTIKDRRIMHDGKVRPQQDNDDRDNKQMP